MLFVLGDLQGFVRMQLGIFKVWVGQTVDMGGLKLTD